MKSLLKKRTGLKEQGVSMVEFAIILPLIFILFMGVIEGALALNTYLTLTQITREGVRYGSHTPSLKFEEEQNNLTCSKDCGGHKKIHKKVLKLIKENEIDKRIYGKKSPSITSFLEKKNEGNFKVKIQIPYKGWLFIKGVNITIEDTGPYLFPNG